MTLRRTIAEFAATCTLLAAIIALSPGGCAPAAPQGKAAPPIFAAVGTGGNRPGPQGPPGWPGTRPPGLFDVRDFGAVEGQSSGASLPAAFEAVRTAISLYQAAHPGMGCTLRLPAGHWYTSVPILWDLDYTRIVGDGADATVLESTGGFPPLILGVRRAPNGVTLSADHWVDLNGKLDFATAPGLYYGIRTKTDAHVAFWASPFSFTGCATDGSTAYWSGVRQLTIDFCVDWNGTTPPTGNTCDLFGLWDATRPSPWRVMVNGSTYYFDAVLSDGVQRRFSFGLPAGVAPSGVHRVSIQLDTIGGTCRAYVGSTNANRVQVAVNVPGTFGPTTNLPFLANEIHPFLIGGVSNNAADPGGANHVDRSFYGLQVSRSLLYKDVGVGQPQARIDNATITDTNALYNGNSAATIAYLNAVPVLNGPGTANGRLVRYRAGLGSGYSSYGYGLFLSSNVQFNSDYNIFGQEVHDLTAKTMTGAAWGTGLTISGNFALNITGVHAYGGWHGIGSLFTGGAWPTIIDRCRVQGYDAGLMLMAQIAQVSHLDCGPAGTTAIRFHGTGSLRDVFVNDQPSRGRATILWHTSDGYSRLDVDHLVIDNEGFPFPTQGVLVAENSRGGRVMLVARDWFVNLVGGPSCAAVALVDNPLGLVNGQGAPTAIVESILAGGHNYRAIVTTDGPLWKGKIRGQPVVAGESPILLHIGPGSSGMVVESYP